MSAVRAISTLPTYEGWASWPAAARALLSLYTCKALALHCAKHTLSLQQAKHLQKCTHAPSKARTVTHDMSHICLWLCAGLFVCCCSWADKITGKVLPTDTPHHAYTLIEPLGVVAAVSHYNI